MYFIMNFFSNQGKPKFEVFASSKGPRLCHPMGGKQDKISVRKARGGVCQIRFNSKYSLWVSDPSL